MFANQNYVRLGMVDLNDFQRILCDK
ncbi:hypothetical protein BCEP27_170051 [Burkholderia cepacia]